MHLPLSSLATALLCLLTAASVVDARPMPHARALGHGHHRRAATPPVQRRADAVPTTFYRPSDPRMFGGARKDADVLVHSNSALVATDSVAADTAAAADNAAALAQVVAQVSADSASSAPSKRDVVVAAAGAVVIPHDPRVAGGAKPDSAVLKQSDTSKVASDASSDLVGSVETAPNLNRRDAVPAAACAPSKAKREIAAKPGPYGGIPRVVFE